MTVIIGVAINERRYILSYKSIKSARLSLKQRIKNALIDCVSSLAAPMFSLGVA